MKWNICVLVICSICALAYLLTEIYEIGYLEDDIKKYAFGVAIVSILLTFAKFLFDSGTRENIGNGIDGVITMQQIKDKYCSREQIYYFIYDYQDNRWRYITELEYDNADVIVEIPDEQAKHLGYPTFSQTILTELERWEAIHMTC